MQIIKSYANLVRSAKIFCRPESEEDVPTNTEKTSKLAWQCLQIQFWLSLFLDVRLKVNDENLICLQYACNLSLQQPPQSDSRVIVLK